MIGHNMRARAAEIAAACALLTRLPVEALFARLPQAKPAEAVWAYPIAGVMVGLIGGGVYWVGAALSLPSALAAIWSLVAMVLATGALHEDGLADFADGFGGRTREGRLEIMRDSRMGAYGAIALAFCLGLRGAAIAILAEPGLVLAGLAAATAASRATAGCLMAMLPPARGDGLSAAIGRPSFAAAGVGVGISVLIAVIGLDMVPALCVLAGAGLGVLAVGSLAKRSLGGQTGDVLGASIMIAECLALTALVAVE